MSNECLANVIPHVYQIVSCTPVISTPYVSNIFIMYV